MTRYFLNKNGITTASLTRQDLIEQFLIEGITIDEQGKEHGEHTWHEITEAEHIARQPKEVEYKPSKEEQYKDKVESLIRVKYSVSDELAILRQKDIDERHRKRYDEYNAYCEQCCKQAHAEVYGKR